MSETVHQRIVLALAMFMVIEGMFKGLGEELKQEPKMRFNTVNKHLIGFTKYMLRADKVTADEVIAKGKQIAELFENNKSIYVTTREEGLADKSNSDS